MNTIDIRLASSFLDIAHSGRIYGTVTVTPKGRVTVCALSRSTLDVLGSTTVLEDGTWELNIQPMSPESILVIAKDEEGVFNCDIFDRCSQSVDTIQCDSYFKDELIKDAVLGFIEIPFYLDLDVLRYNGEIIHENIYPNITGVTVNPDNSLEFSNGENSLYKKNCILDIDDLDIPLLDGVCIPSKDLNRIALHPDKDILGDSSCIEYFPILSLESKDSLGLIDLQNIFKIGTKTVVPQNSNKFHNIPSNIGTRFLPVSDFRMDNSWGIQSTAIGTPNTFCMLLKFYPATVSLGSATYMPFLIVYNQDTTNWITFQLNTSDKKLYVNGAGLTSQTVCSAALPIGSLFHLAITVTNSAVKVYVNSVLSGSYNHSLPFYGTNIGQSPISCLFGLVSTWVNSYYTGNQFVLGRVRIFNKELSTEELNTVHSADMVAASPKMFQINGAYETVSSDSFIGRVGIENNGYLINFFDNKKLIHGINLDTSFLGSVVDADGFRFSGGTILHSGASTSSTDDIKALTEISELSIIGNILWDGSNSSLYKCIYQSGNDENGIAIGHDSESYLAVYSRNNGILSTLKSNIKIYPKEYRIFILSKNTLKIYSEEYVLIDTSIGTVSIGNSNIGQESIGGVAGKSVFSGNNGPTEYFSGNIRYLYIFQSPVFHLVLDKFDVVAVQDGYSQESLPIEVEYIDPFGNCFIHTKVPHISSAGTHILRLYVNNSKFNINVSLSKDSDGAVWDDNFLGVYHCSSLENGILIDSSRYKNHLYLADGAVVFNEGESDSYYLDFNTQSLAYSTESYLLYSMINTAEMLVKSNSVVDGVLFSTGESDLGVGITAQFVNQKLRFGTNADYIETTDIIPDSEIYVGFTLNDLQPSLLVNGITPTISSTGGLIEYMFNDQPFTVAAKSVDDAYVGLSNIGFSEIRLSRNTRSNTWIDFSRRCLNDSVISHKILRLDNDPINTDLRILPIASFNFLYGAFRLSGTNYDTVTRQNCATYPIANCKSNYSFVFNQDKVSKYNASYFEIVLNEDITGIFGVGLAYTGFPLHYNIGQYYGYTPAVGVSIDPSNLESFKANVETAGYTIPLGGRTVHTKGTVFGFYLDLFTYNFSISINGEWVTTSGFSSSFVNFRVLPSHSSSVWLRPTVCFSNDGASATFVFNENNFKYCPNVRCEPIKLSFLDKEAHTLSSINFVPKLSGSVPGKSCLDLSLNGLKFSTYGTAITIKNIPDSVLGYGFIFNGNSNAVINLDSRDIFYPGYEDFHLDVAFRRNTTCSMEYLFGSRDSSSRGFYAYFEYGIFCLAFCKDDTNTSQIEIIRGTTAVQDFEDHYITITKRGSIVYLLIDGVMDRVYQLTSGMFGVDSTFVLGGAGVSDYAYLFRGNIYRFRILKGVYLYDSNYELPSPITYSNQYLWDIPRCIRADTYFLEGIDLQSISKPFWASTSSGVIPYNYAVDFKSNKKLYFEVVFDPSIYGALGDDRVGFAKESNINLLDGALLGNTFTSGWISVSPRGQFSCINNISVSGAFSFFSLNPTSPLIVVGIAVDCQSKKIHFSSNGRWCSSLNPENGDFLYSLTESDLSDDSILLPAISMYRGGSAANQAHGATMINRLDKCFFAPPIGYSGMVQPKSSFLLLNPSFFTGDSVSDSVYVNTTSESIAGYYAFASFSKYKLDISDASSCWKSASGQVTNQKWNCDLLRSVRVDHIVIINGHGINSTNLDIGINNFKLFGTDSATAFANTSPENTTDLTLLGTFQAGTYNMSRPAQKFYVNASTPYRYYVLFFIDNHGSTSFMSIRNIEFYGVNTNLSNSINVHFDVNRVDTHLYNFPAMLRLDTSVGISGFDSSFIFDSISSYRKLYAYDEDGNSLPIEVVSWDADSRIGKIYTKVPKILGNNGYLNSKCIFCLDGTQESIFDVGPNSGILKWKYNVNQYTPFPIISSTSVNGHYGHYSYAPATNSAVRVSLSNIHLTACRNMFTPGEDTDWCYHAYYHMTRPAEYNKFRLLFSIAHVWTNILSVGINFDTRTLAIYNVQDYGRIHTPTEVPAPEEGVLFHFAFVRKNNRYFIYIDGKQLYSGQFAIQWSGSMGSSDYFTIGAFANFGSPFSGDIILPTFIYGDSVFGGDFVPPIDSVARNSDSTFISLQFDQDNEDNPLIAVSGTEVAATVWEDYDAVFHFENLSLDGLSLKDSSVNLSDLHFSKELFTEIDGIHTVLGIENYDDFASSLLSDSISNYSVECNIVVDPNLTGDFNIVTSDTLDIVASFDSLEEEYKLGKLGGYHISRSFAKDFSKHIVFSGSPYITEIYEASSEYVGSELSAADVSLDMSYSLHVSEGITYIDSFRISSVFRDAAWKNATFLCQEDMMCAYDNSKSSIFINDVLEGWESSSISELTLDTSSLDEDLYNFPVSIKLSDNCGVTNTDYSNFFRSLLGGFSSVGGPLKVYDFARNRGTCGLNINSKVIGGIGSQLGLHYDSGFTFDRAANSTNIVVFKNSISFGGEFTLGFRLCGIFNDSSSPYKFHIIGKTDTSSVTFYGDFEIYCSGSASGSNQILTYVHELEGGGTSSASFQYYIDRNVPTSFLFIRKINSINPSLFDLSLYVDNMLISTEVVSGSVKTNRFSDIQIGYKGTDPTDSIIDSIIVHPKAFTISEVRGYFSHFENGFPSKLHRTVLCVQDQTVPPALLSSPLYSIQVYGELSSRKNVFISVSFDNSTFYIYDSSWKAICSNDPAVHGVTNDVSWYFKNEDGDWIKSTVDNTNSAISAATAFESNRAYVQFLSDWDFSVSGYNAATGICTVALTLHNDSILPESIHDIKYVTKVGFNNKKATVSDAIALDTYSGKLALAECNLSFVNSGFINITDIAVYTMLSTQSEWHLYNGGQINGITELMDTIGVSLYIKVEVENSIDLEGVNVNFIVK